MVENALGVGKFVISEFIPEGKADVFVEKSNQMIPISTLEAQARGLFTAKIKMDRAVVQLLSQGGQEVVLRMTSKYLRPNSARETTFFSTYSTEKNVLWQPFYDCYSGLNTIHVRAVHPSALFTQSVKLGGKGSDRPAEFSKVIKGYVDLYHARVQEKEDDL